MAAEGSPRKPKKRAPLGPERLRDLALFYVARYATSQAKLERYLARKVYERGWDNEHSEGGDAQAAIEALGAEFAERGYIDDAAFAEMRRRDLLARGYGPRRIAQDLHAAGVEEPPEPPESDGWGQHAPSREQEEWSAAVRFARKRRFGPFHSEPFERDIREKQIAAMLRAGHGFDTVKLLVDWTEEELPEVDRLPASLM